MKLRFFFDWEAEAAPAGAVAVSRTDILGGGGAGRRGVFWLMTARAGREGDAVAGVGASIFSSWAMLNLSLRPSAAPLSLLRLKVGGGSFS